MAKTVFAFIVTIFISASLHSLVYAAGVSRTSAKADSSGGFSVSSTVGNHIFAGSEQRNVTPLYGVKVGYEKIDKSIADSIGIEGSLNYFTNRSKVDANSDTGYLFRLDVTYPFAINKKWIPFIAIGAGGIAIDSTTNTSANFLLNYGVGVKYFLENYLALRVDVRQLGIVESSTVRKNFEAGVGLSYYFGKERIKKIVALPVPEKKKIVVLEDVPVKNEEVTKPAGTDSGVIAVKKTTAEGTVVPPAVDTPVTPVIKNEIVKRLSVGFDKKSARIKPNYLVLFKEVVGILNKSDDMVAHIEGYADVAGELSANKLLPEQRAQSVLGSLVHLGANQNQLSIIADGPVKTIADNATISGRQKNRRVDIIILKLDPLAKMKAEQERQLEVDRIEKMRLEAEILAKSRIKASIVLQEVKEALPVDSSGNLSFEIVNRGVSTEQYMMTLIAPKEFDGVLTRANRPDETVSLLHLAPGETFRGNVLFRIPSGMVDGQKTIVTVKAVSTKYRDVFFQKESLIISSAPLIRTVAKLDKQVVAPGEKLRYHLMLLNAGSLSVRTLSVRLQLPPQVEFIGASGMPFTQDAAGMIVFKIDTIASGSLAEINIDMKVHEDSKIGTELLWNTEVIDGSLQRRAKFTDWASVVQTK